VYLVFRHGLMGTIRRAGRARRAAEGIFRAFQRREREIQAIDSRPSARDDRSPCKVERDYFRFDRRFLLLENSRYDESAGPDAALRSCPADIIAPSVSRAYIINARRGYQEYPGIRCARRAGSYGTAAAVRTRRVTALTATTRLRPQEPFALLFTPLPHPRASPPIAPIITARAMIPMVSIIIEATLSPDVRFPYGP